MQLIRISPLWRLLFAFAIEVDGTLSLHETLLARNRHLQRFGGFDRHADGELRCSHRKDFHPPQRLTALDTWEEILDLPEDLRKEHFGVVRAQKNWLARLPAACIVIQMNVWAVIQPNEPVRWAFCCPQHFPWAAVEADNSVMAGSPTPASGRAVESAGSQVLKDSLAIIDESGYASDDTVRTVEHYEPAKDGRDAVLQLFIY